MISRLWRLTYNWKFRDQPQLGCIFLLMDISMGQDITAELDTASIKQAIDENWLSSAQHIDRAL